MHYSSTSSSVGSDGAEVVTCLRLLGEAVERRAIPGGRNGTTGTSGTDHSAPPSLSLSPMRYLMS